ncbi:hypothetical protein DFJ73DRAFT_813873 [Zopfochytrium polystomum]|nr:hypothetical protein DFJ73DRAFT_813873 [Zopfochytrium polystomum]
MEAGAATPAARAPAAKAPPARSIKSHRSQSNGRWCGGSGGAPSEDVNGWLPSDVASWLSAQGFRFSDILPFTANAIDGRALLEMTPSRARQIGVPDSRIATLIAGVKRLRQAQPDYRSTHSRHQRSASRQSMRSIGAAPSTNGLVSDLDVEEIGQPEPRRGRQRAATSPNTSTSQDQEESTRQARRTSPKAGPTVSRPPPLPSQGVIGLGGFGLANQERHSRGERRPSGTQRSLMMDHMNDEANEGDLEDEGSPRRRAGRKSRSLNRELPSLQPSNLTRPTTMDRGGHSRRRSQSAEPSTRRGPILGLPPLDEDVALTSFPASPSLGYSLSTDVSADPVLMTKSPSVWSWAKRSRRTSKVLDDTEPEENVRRRAIDGIVPIAPARETLGANDSFIGNGTARKSLGLQGIFKGWSKHAKSKESRQSQPETNEKEAQSSKRKSLLSLI